MSLKRQADIARITEVLSYIRSQVELSAPNNFTDINIYAENFYRDFLNLIFGYSLANINILEPNAAAIDLGDLDEGISFQVTSTSDLKKVKNTISKFNAKDLHTKYDKLIVINITKKKSYKSQLLGDPKKLQINPKEHVWDVSDLLGEIGNKTAPEIEKIRAFLDNQVIWKKAEHVSAEILTFQALMTMLSDESQPGAGDGYIEEPDPKGKIEERFASHEEFLKTEFRDLYSEYGAVLGDVRDHADLGAVKLRRLSLHLKTFSDKILTEHGGDAKKALSILEEIFGKRLSDSGLHYDGSAVRFFLIDELIKCNVFPNKENAIV
ncbi:SMEK domain-containing protein [Hyphomonas atlantica]|uniref:SMEK domain-containing protein n=1 Tax=Hyphomonas atlantica TaxID=1280948 RepID=A0A059DZA1_9PROT|nr:SMEK domain-containing protein [Hyphomonas atlantica]KCZ60304.1 hypothetical protein HY36_17600 [Hyphomonas atlantica]